MPPVGEAGGGMGEPASGIKVVEESAPEPVGEMQSDAERDFTGLQFCLDAFFPSTLTLVISIILQNLVECNANKGLRYSWTVIAIIFTIIYAFSCLFFRTALSFWRFLFFVGITVALVVICFKSISQLRDSKNRIAGNAIGISD